MKLNKACELEDWMLPYIAPFPKHRKCWEYEYLMEGLRQLGVLSPNAWALAVAGGHESPVYQLTNHLRWVFCTDLYANADFPESDGAMLRDPDLFACCPYNRRRLVVQHMNALDLRYEDETFDLVFSLSSVEHFGGMEESRKSLREMARILKPGGLAAITTELVVNGGDYLETPNLQLFSPAALRELVTSADGLSPVEPIDFSVSDKTRETVTPLTEPGKLPHIVLSWEGREFTSVSVFLRKMNA